MFIDYWYGHCKKDIAFISYSFSDLDCIYRGNIYDKDKKIIGDFSTYDSLEIEKYLKGDFDKC